MKPWTNSTFSLYMNFLGIYKNVFALSLEKGSSINYVSMPEGGRGLPNAHGCSRGGGGCI